VVVITNSNFKEEVIDSKGITLLVFWSEVCLQCSALKKNLETLSQDFFLKICLANISQVNDLAIEYDILALPTTIVFKDGVKKILIVGNAPVSVLKSKISNV